LAACTQKSNKRLERSESSLIATGNDSKKNRDKEIDEDDAEDDDVLNGSESLFATFAQNTVLIHDEFKQFAITKRKNQWHA